MMGRRPRIRDSAAYAAAMAGGAANAAENAANWVSCLCQAVLGLLSRFEEDGLDVGIEKRGPGLLAYKLHFGLPPEIDETPPAADAATT